MTQGIIDLCNAALQKVGAASITTLDDDSPEARACNLAYDSNRKSELRKRPWNFAIKRAVLAPDADAPAFDYDYAFSLPTDCLRVIRPATSNLDWQIEGRKILTNDSDTLYLRYIADITDPTQWDAAFYDMAAIALACDICEKLTQSNTKKKAIEGDYDDALKAATLADAFEGGPQDPSEDDWLLARL